MILELLLAEMRLACRLLPDISFGDNGKSGGAGWVLDAIAACRWDSLKGLGKCATDCHSNSGPQVVVLMRKLLAL